MESFSSKLVKARKEANLSIDEISEKTKIRPHIIKAIEEGNFSSLEPVYARSFVKTYATFLKVPEADVNEALDRIFAVEEKKEPEPVAEEPEKPVTRKLDKKSLNEIFFSKKDDESPSRLKKILKYVMLFIIGAGSVYFIIYLFNPDGNNRKDYIGSDAMTAEDSAKVLALQEEQKELFKLEAKAVDTVTTTFKIHVDKNIDETVTLAPKMKKQWDAENKIVLSGLIAGSVEFYRNGELLKPFGEKGSMVKEITIYKDRVVSSALFDDVIQDSTTVDSSKSEPADKPQTSGSSTSKPSTSSSSKPSTSSSSKPSTSSSSKPSTSSSSKPSTSSSSKPSTSTSKPPESSSKPPSGDTKPPSNG